MVNSSGRPAYVRMALSVLACLALTSQPIAAQSTRPVLPPAETPMGRPVPRPPITNPPRPERPWGGHSGDRRSGYLGSIRCESYAGMTRNCRAVTRNRVVLERRLHGRCREGSSWGYDATRIWVSRNCRATFAYGRGNYYPRYRPDNNNNTGLIIGGVVVAAGLAAVLSSKGSGSGTSSSNPQFAPRSSADAVVDYDRVPARARAGLKLCMAKASQNVAATGGSRLQMTNVETEDVDDGLDRFTVDINATYPDKARMLAFSCTASTSSVEDFDFITE